MTDNTAPSAGALATRRWREAQQLGICKLNIDIHQDALRGHVERGLVSADSVHQALQKVSGETAKERKERRGSLEFDIGYLLQEIGYGKKIV